MNENKSKEEIWRDEFEKDIPSYNLNKVWNGDYFLERIHHQWIGYLAGRKASEKEIEELKKKTGFTAGFYKCECNNCGHDRSRED